MKILLVVDLFLAEVISDIELIYTNVHLMGIWWVHNVHVSVRILRPTLWKIDEKYTDRLDI